MTDWTRQYRKALTFSYDDGNEADVRLVRLLDAYGMKCTFNLNSGLDSSDVWQYRGADVRRLELTQCRALYAGHEIAVHGSRHLSLTALSPEALDAELAGDKKRLTELFGTEPVGMAYAYGEYNDAAVEKLRSIGIRYARTVEDSHSFAVQSDLLHFRPTCHHDDPQLFALAERFLAMEPDEPQIFCIWGHSYELDGNANWDRLERLFAMLAGKEEIFYGTNAQVLLFREELC
ncbi:MAG: polysaccharide deacetylase family protein [Oscillospiraceae bacterium]|nr:polysaccharide deacetylase family protein [Oscillospiraceae bacterium]